MKLVLVANKCDVGAAGRVVSEQEGIEKAREWGIPYFEASAKTNINVDECFMRVTKEIIDNLDGKTKGEDSSVKLRKNTEGRRGGTCC